MEIDFEELGRRAATRLYEVEGIKFGEFTLTSGKTSPYYVDLRIVPSYPDLFDDLTDMAASIVEDELCDMDRLAGVPTGGLPLGALVAHKTGLPMFYTRKREKPHGRKKAVEGVLEEGDEVAVLDDISTTGGSILGAVETIREAGGEVGHAVVLVDREEGASENLRDEGIELNPCLSVSDITEYLREDSRISEEEYSTIQGNLGRE